MEKNNISKDSNDYWFQVVSASTGDQISNIWYSRLTDKWFYSDETSDFCGPFESMSKAEDALWEYIERLMGEAEQSDLDKKRSGMDFLARRD